MSTTRHRFRRERRTITTARGAAYRLRAAPSGYVDWPPGAAQYPIAWLVHGVATVLVSRLVFWGGWTVVVWRGDDLAPKRERVLKRRFRTRAAAIEALAQLEQSIGRYGILPA